MANKVRGTVGKGKEKVKAPGQPISDAHAERIKAALTARGGYDAVVAKSGRSWFMVWAVINRRKTSRPIMEVIESLVGDLRRAA